MTPVSPSVIELVTTLPFSLGLIELSTPFCSQMLELDLAR